MVRPYRLFGRTLLSDVGLPGLPESNLPEGPIGWTLRTVEALPREPVPPIHLGSEFVGDELQIELWRHHDGFLLRFNDTGTFRISGNGSMIEWLPGARVVPRALAADVVGRVLAAALHARGLLTLHACAVAFGRAATVFVGAKGTGKSSLGSALTLVGARQMADDAVPVEVGPRARAWPGLPRIRLDERPEVRATRSGLEFPAGDAPWTPPSSSPDRMESGPLPITAVYLLVPVRAGTATPLVRRTRIPSPRPALAIFGEATTGPLLGGSERKVVLGRCATLTRSVPVYALRIASGLDRLTEVALTVSSWHGQVGATA